MQKISGILNTNLAKTAGRFVSRKAKISDLDWAFRDIYYQAMRAELFEHLLLFDEFAIVMNTDNSPLGILVGEFGINDAAHLIESGAIKLILRRVILTSKLGNDKVEVIDTDGIPPVIPGMVVSDNIFGDPIKCINDAFNYIKYNYSKK